jgi:hypothetical protein
MSSNEVTMPVWQEKHLRAATTAAGVALRLEGPHPHF